MLIERKKNWLDISLIRTHRYIFIYFRLLQPFKTVGLQKGTYTTHIYTLASTQIHTETYIRKIVTLISFICIHTYTEWKHEQCIRTYRHTYEQLCRLREGNRTSNFPEDFGSDIQVVGLVTGMIAFFIPMIVSFF